MGIEKDSEQPTLPGTDESLQTASGRPRPVVDEMFVLTKKLRKSRRSLEKYQSDLSAYRKLPVTTRSINRERELEVRVDYWEKEITFTIREMDRLALKWGM